MHCCYSVTVVQCVTVYAKKGLVALFFDGVLVLQCYSVCRKALIALLFDSVTVLQCIWKSADSTVL